MCGSAEVYVDRESYKDYNSLFAAFVELQKENSQLRADNHKLDLQCKALEGKRKELYDENDRLRQQIRRRYSGNRNPKPRNMKRRGK